MLPRSDCVARNVDDLHLSRYWTLIWHASPGLFLSRAPRGEFAMPMLARLLHLFVSVLLIGPLSAPGWATVHPEDRVGGSPDFSSIFASESASQVAESHQENPACGYDFASGLHKYLYAENDPVNNIDPSGHMSISSVYYSVGAQLFLMTSRLAAFPRIMGLARATATTLTVGSLMISDEARVAFLSTGNPGAAAASLVDDVGFMIYRGGTLLQRSASTLARSGVTGSLEGPLGAASRRIKSIASDAVVGFRGSVASGVKHSTQCPFDPTDFDLDAFIVSDKLAKQIPGRGFRDGNDIAAVAAEAKKIEELLKQSFSGYRTEPGKPFTFRIWTTEEFERIVREGPYVIH